MNTLLPAGIEKYFTDAGFSPTEMLVLKKLVEEEPFTMRELAQRTGKSTGVLDQAMKKLLAKGIAKRDSINEHTKYTIQSLQAISDWVKSDMKRQEEIMKRKYKDFESFIATLKVEKQRPNMEYYNGLDGIKQAYAKLLESGKEWLVYKPAIIESADDPLAEFRVELFRRRQVRGIFQRVIAPDSTLARRYQSRDSFEYRRTVLTTANQDASNVEKIIVDNVVACINPKELSASFIRYPEMADMEKSRFEDEWKRLYEAEKAASLKPGVPAPAVYVIPLKTRVLSETREFFLSKKSIAFFGLIALIAGSMTFGFYRNIDTANFKRMQETAKSIAATAAIQFDARDIEALQVEADWQKPEWGKVVGQLEQIRIKNPGVVYAYILRKDPKDAEKILFVADSHSRNPYANTDTDPTNDVDANGDGKAESGSGPDLLQWPGQMNPSPAPAVPEGFEHATTEKNFYTDQWGKVLTGYSPIASQDGKGVATLAIDLRATQLDSLNAESFSPLAVFFTLFLFFVLIRFFMLHMKLIQELWKCVGRYRIITGIILGIVVVFSIGWGFYIHTLNLLTEETGRRLMSIAATAATEFDPADLDQLRWARDMKTDAYQRVFDKLNEIREKNPDIKYAYILRKIDGYGLYEFIADADSNYNLPLIWNPLEENWADKADPVNENIWPGVNYYIPKLINFYDRSLYSVDTDQWGTTLAGSAPILDKNANTVGNLGLSIELSSLNKKAINLTLGL